MVITEEMFNDFYREIMTDQWQQNAFEYDRMMADVEQYGYNQNGMFPEYGGLRWKMKRNQQMNYWCGYLYLNSNERRLSKETWNEVEYASHGGITFDEHECIGFDCAHGGDFPLFCDGRFRDFDHVLSALRQMAKVIWTTQNRKRKLPVKEHPAGKRPKMTKHA